jgi:hypothetical protein
MVVCAQVCRYFCRRRHCHCRSRRPLLPIELSLLSVLVVLLWTCLWPEVHLVQAFAFAFVHPTKPSFVVGMVHKANDGDSIGKAALKRVMEETVIRYFAGVSEKNATKIRSCFGKSAVIHDVGVVNVETDPPPLPQQVDAETLVQRCMDFCAAHPDVQVSFVYGPECGRSSDWVVAHWVEMGTWSGAACGIAPPHPARPMTAQGQTRFLVDVSTLHIVHLVVTRTFTEWEILVRRQAVSS